MINNKKNSIFTHLSEPICCGCGVCAAVCPTNAISIEVTAKGINFPRLNREKCIDCGKCHKVCPGSGVNFSELSREVFGAEPEDCRVGQYVSIYKGYALDQELRCACSSGGMITAVLLSLLKKKSILGAVVTRLSYRGSIRAEAFIARTEDEIIGSRGSKYCPVSFDEALKEVTRLGIKVAVVCLPCHAIAIRKALAIDEKLKKSIAYIFTVFCNQAPSYKALRYFLHKRGVKESDVQNFQWRGEGWPGTTKAVTKDGVSHPLFFPDAWSSVFGSSYFTPSACYCCYDFFGEFSDISFGDAWLPETADDKIGTNVVISRSQAGDDILKEIVQAKEVFLEKLSKDDLVAAFAVNIKAKKSGYPLHKKLIKGCPNFCSSQKAEQLNLKNSIKEIKRLIKMKLGEALFHG